MRQPRTPWPTAERAQLVDAFEGLQKLDPVEIHVMPKFVAYAQL